MQNITRDRTAIYNANRKARLVKIQAEIIEAGHKVCVRCDGGGDYPSRREYGMCLNCYGRGWVPSREEHIAVAAIVRDLYIAGLVKHLDEIVETGRREAADIEKYEAEEAAGKVRAASIKEAARRLAASRANFVAVRDQLRVARAMDVADYCRRGRWNKHTIHAIGIMLRAAN